MPPLRDWSERIECRAIRRERQVRKTGLPDHSIHGGEQMRCRFGIARPCRKQGCDSDVGDEQLWVPRLARFVADRSKPRPGIGEPAKTDLTCRGAELELLHIALGIACSSQASRRRVPQLEAARVFASS